MANKRVKVPTVVQLNKASHDHYSQDDGPLLFYGGVFSNFVGNPLVISAPQPWHVMMDNAAGALYERPYYRVEHFYQASKATTQKAHDAIANEYDPWRSKGMGQVVTLRDGWDEWASIYYMLIGLRHKYQYEPNAAAMLLGTSDRYLAEDSPTDAIWGLRTRVRHSGKDGLWGGRNLLGLCLMVVRSELRGEKPIEQIDLVMEHATSKDDIGRFMRAMAKPWYATWDESWRNQHA